MCSGVCLELLKGIHVIIEVFWDFHDHCPSDSHEVSERVADPPQITIETILRRICHHIPERRQSEPQGIPIVFLFRTITAVFNGVVPFGMTWATENRQVHQVVSPTFDHRDDMVSGRVFLTGAFLAKSALVTKKITLDLGGYPTFSILSFRHCSYINAHSWKSDLFLEYEKGPRFLRGLHQYDERTARYVRTIAGSHRRPPSATPAAALFEYLADT